MGTRHLIAVQSGGEYKVAQYGQWDGYPRGQGTEVLTFLSNKQRVKKFKAKLDLVRFLDEEGRDKAFIEAHEKNAHSNPDKRTPKQKAWFDKFITRNLGAKILTSIVESEDKEILLRNEIDFAGDSLFCEYAYVIDFDKGTLEVYRGFNKKKLKKTERFAKMKGDSEGYEPIRFWKSFSLSDLPTKKQFLAALTEGEEQCPTQ